MEQLLPLAIVAGVLLLPLIWFIATYNRFNALRQHLRESWSGIEVELQRRYDLIPNLVETVKGYAAHERAVLNEVTHLRNQAAANHGAIKSQSDDERALDLGLKKLYAVAEAYPDLKANHNFLALQQELAITEDRIAATRRFYNGNVRGMNQLCEQFPTNLVASMFGFEKGDYFEAGEGAERMPSAAVS
jgi:LemA protein